MAALLHWGSYLIPIMIFFIPVYAWWKGVPVYETFVEGAGEGLKTAVKILPFLTAMLVALHIFRAGGVLDGLAQLLNPLLEPLGIPGEVTPLALMRPLSGSGALGVTADLLHAYGPDSPIGLLASVMQGSTDTTFYVLTVYFGAVGLKQHRHALAAGLTADLAAFIAAALLCRVFFP